MKLFNDARNSLYEKRASLRVAKESVRQEFMDAAMMVKKWKSTREHIAELLQEVITWVRIECTFKSRRRR